MPAELVASLLLLVPTTITAQKPFARQNPKTDKFTVHSFHHVEVYCADATNTAGNFQNALGMHTLAKTRNNRFTSTVIGSGNVKIAFTAPLPVPQLDRDRLPPDGLAKILDYDETDPHAFIATHGGVAVRAVCLHVADVHDAFQACVDGGGDAVLEPRALRCDAESTTPMGHVAEVRLYGDVVLRLLSLDCSYAGAHMPGYEDEPTNPHMSDDYGIMRFDHIVGNVWEMMPTIERLQRMLGFHEFAEFTAEDVGTVDSGLNSMVLSNNAQNVLLPINEPTYGTRRRSQIETYLLSNVGEGVQHMALATEDIFTTVRAMRAAGDRGGFTFMDPPGEDYYAELPERIGSDVLTVEQFEEVRELGLLVDRDPEGALVQVFTRPVGDRPTLFLEIIQRIGCMYDTPGSLPGSARVQAGGCGGFGKGNFKALFKAVEDYERSLEED